MAIGPGKYDDICTNVRLATDAACTLIIILDGNKGSSLSCQIDKTVINHLRLADMLEDMARQIRNDV